MSDPTAVLLDFAGQRKASSFEAWSPQLRARCVLLTGADDAALPTSTRAYAEALADRLEDARPTHLMAYCLSTGIAQELARVLVDRGGRPVTLTAFDPTVCEPADFAIAYREIATQVLPDGRLPLLTIDEELVRRDVGDVLNAVESDIGVRTFAALGRPVVEGDRLVETLVERCIRWLRYLTLAIGSTWPTWGGDAVRICSLNHDTGGVWDGMANVTSHHLTVPREHLLSSDEVRAYAERILA